MSFEHRRRHHLQSVETSTSNKSIRSRERHIKQLSTIFVKNKTGCSKPDILIHTSHPNLKSSKTVSETKQFSHHQLQVKTEMAFTSQFHKKTWSRVPWDRMTHKGSIVALLLHQERQESTIQQVHTHRIHGTGISSIIYSIIPTFIYHIKKKTSKRRYVIIYTVYRSHGISSTLQSCTGRFNLSSWLKNCTTREITPRSSGRK